MTTTTLTLRQREALMNAAHKIEIRREGTGLFNAYVDGKKTDLEIYNGSNGMSGRNTTNTYGVVNHTTGVVKWLGPLNTCKTAVRMTLVKRFEEGKL